MTRKDYTLISSALHAELVATSDGLQRRGIIRAAWRLCREFLSQNWLFDADRFMCDVHGEGNCTSAEAVLHIYGVA